MSSYHEASWQIWDRISEVMETKEIEKTEDLCTVRLQWEWSRCFGSVLVVCISVDCRVGMLVPRAR